METSNEQESIESHEDDENNEDQTDNKNDEDVSEYSEENSNDVLNEAIDDLENFLQREKEILFLDKQAESNYLRTVQSKRGHVSETLTSKDLSPPWKLFNNFKTYKGAYYASGFAIIFSIIIPVFLVHVHVANSEKKIDIQELKTNFPRQDEYLWLAFESGVQDVKYLNRPSTFILLYQEEAQKTLANLLQQLSKYAVCNIRDCSKEPIIITDGLLNSSEIVDDYGIMIHRYRDELQEKGVMIIKNLENVRGVSAQAFHSFCDEVTPLVDKSLFIFTMKVEKLHDHDKMKYVEDYFRNKWTDIKVDTYNALITRISSMVIEVMP
ncbi:LAP1C domain containing protein [Asbolus verrucosus]|uniref:LAP1C domain containing protein n=1 Tax=Asbolus verrucosus TaxID=1661398 RepID=A0A482W9Z4_ASBVE|nr:LAP1C domain containing protein [Asbolus verrucosus]